MMIDEKYQIDTFQLYVMMNTWSMHIQIMLHFIM